MVDERVSTMSTRPSGVRLSELTADDHRVVERLLFREAQLLDERRLEEWLELFSDDVDYVVISPTSPSATAWPDMRHASVFLDQPHLPVTLLTKATMALRVRRLLSGRALDDDPPVPTVRMITNVDAVRLDSDTLSVRSAFLLCRDVGDTEKMLSGTRRDTLLVDNGTLRIARRIVEVNATSYPFNFIFV